MTYLMKSSYRTNYFDYTKLGCQSGQDCIDKCNIDSALKQCNALLLSTKVDISNDKDSYHYSNCIHNYNCSVCDEKLKSPDCVIEYYIIESMISSSLNGNFHEIALNKYNASKKGMTKDWNLFTNVKIYFNGELDTIYRHSPAQCPVEFICFIGGVISLWTGFSVISMLIYGNRFITNKKFQSNQKVNSLFEKRTKSFSIVKKIYNLKSSKRIIKKIFVRGKNLSKNIDLPI